jgi:hypothetical protein
MIWHVLVTTQKIRCKKTYIGALLALRKLHDVQQNLEDIGSKNKIKDKKALVEQYFTSELRLYRIP